MRETLSPDPADLIVKAEEIARFLYGNADPSSLRQVYRNPLGLSFFRHGLFIAALKSTLRRELAERERKAREARSGGQAA